MSNSKSPRIPLEFNRLSEDEMMERADGAFHRMQGRRSVRHFDPTPVPLEVLRRCILAAGTAPSGAHKQPWTFCLVTNADVKRSIREAAEKEEYANYHGRMSTSWLEDLQVFDTDYHKAHLEDASALIVVFRHVWDSADGAPGDRRKNYYVQESVGMACGMLINALHESGLVSLTHTPSPMEFLTEILQRPPNERAFLLIPVGFPAKTCTVPDIKRKKLKEIMVEFH